MSTGKNGERGEIEDVRKLKVGNASRLDGTCTIITKAGVLVRFIFFFYFRLEKGHQWAAANCGKEGVDAYKSCMRISLMSVMKYLTFSERGEEVEANERRQLRGYLWWVDRDRDEDRSCWKYCWKEKLLFHYTAPIVRRGKIGGNFFSFFYRIYTKRTSEYLFQQV